MVYEPESMAGAATITYLIALKMAHRVGDATQERALRISLRGCSGVRRGRKRPSVERPSTDALALEARTARTWSHTEPIEALIGTCSIEITIALRALCHGAWG